MEYETFYDRVKEINGVLYVSIDYKVAQYMGLNKGDNVKIHIKKINKEVE